MPYSDGALGKSSGKISQELKNLVDDLVSAGASQSAGGQITSIGGSSSALTKTVAQTGHGLSVGNAVRFNGTNWVQSKADAAANADVDGLVSAVADANNFTVSLGGDVTGMSGLTAGQDYFLDPSTAGALTTTEPSTPGQVSVPVVKAISTTESVFRPLRGLVIPAKTIVRVPFILIADGTSLATGEDFASYTYEVPDWLNGYTLLASATYAVVKTVSSSGLPTFGIRKGASTEMLSTSLTIDVSETSSRTAATAAVVAGSGAGTIASGDIIHFDCDVAGTGTKGCEITLGFQAP